MVAGVLSESKVSILIFFLLCVLATLIPNTALSESYGVSYEKKYAKSGRADRESRLRAYEKAAALRPVQSQLNYAQQQGSEIRNQINNVSSQASRLKYGSAERANLENSRSALYNQRNNNSSVQSRLRNQINQIESSYRQNFNYQYQWKNKRRGIGIPTEIPSYATSWRMLRSGGYEYRPWVPKASLNQTILNNQASYDTEVNRFAANWDPKAVKWAADWRGWIAGEKKYYESWASKIENRLNTYAEPIVAERARRSYDPFKRRVLSAIETNSMAVEREAIFRLGFVGMELRPLATEYLKEGAPLRELQAHINDINKLEKFRRSDWSRSVLIPWQGALSAPVRGGIKKEWREYSIDNILSKINTDFAPYKRVKTSYLELSRARNEKLTNTLTPWLPTHEADLNKWMAKENQSLESIAKYPHIEVEVASIIKKEKKKRLEFLDWVNTQKAEHDKKVNTLHYELDSKLGRAFDSRRSVNEVLSELSSYWTSQSLSWKDFYNTLKVRWEESGDAQSETERRKAFPGAQALIDLETSRYPISISIKDCEYLYLREKENGVMRLAIKKSGAAKELVEIQEKISWACHKNETVILAKSFSELELEISDELKDEWEQAVKTHEGGLLVYIKNNSLQSVTPVPFEGVSFNQLGFIRDSKRIGVSLNKENKLVKEFVYALNTKTKRFEYMDFKALEPNAEEAWDQARRIDFETAFPQLK